MCGYACEWLRSCYEADWRFDANRPDVLTRGRFVFCPEGTPHFTAPHIFGSKNWTTGERVPAPLLGEVTEGKQRYTRGETPDPFPDAIVLGNSECLSRGESLEGMTDWQFTADGGAAWSADGADTIRLDIADSVNCGGDNSVQQTGDAHVQAVLRSDHTCFITLTARVERQNADYDVGIVYVDGAQVAEVGGLGDGLGCLMADVTATATIPLGPGSHTITMTGDTVDGRYHVACYFALSLTWQPPLAGFAREFIDGYDARCYLPTPRPLLPPQPRPSAFSRADWLYFCRLVQACYLDMTFAEGVAQAYFQNTANVITVPNTASLIPGSLIAWNAELTVVAIPGTTTPQQLVMQILDPGVGLQDFGAYSTPVIWQTACNAIATRLSATAADPGGDIVLTGHSYGGAVACLLAAELRLWNAGRKIQLITYGSPRAGDSRLTDILDTIDRTHLVNASDGVSGVPPVGDELIGLEWIITHALLAQWTESEKMGKQTIIGYNGEVTEDQTTQLHFDALVVLIREIINSETIPLDVAHFIAEYRRRLTLLQG